MDQERFRQLIEAYGARAAHWPTPERIAAAAFLSEHQTAQDELDVARALDKALDAWTAPVVSATLRERILSAAPRRGWSWPDLWLSGAGLAAACAAGAIVGATVITPSLANAVSMDHGDAISPLADGVSAFGAPVDAGSLR